MFIYYNWVCTLFILYLINTPNDLLSLFGILYLSKHCWQSIKYIAKDSINWMSLYLHIDMWWVYILSTHMVISSYDPQRKYILSTHNAFIWFAYEVPFIWFSYAYTFVHTQSFHMICKWSTFHMILIWGSYEKHMNWFMIYIWSPFSMISIRSAYAPHMKFICSEFACDIRTKVRLEGLVHTCTD